MAEQVIHEMISAFAAGCMDKENFINFKDYIDSDGELPYRELGEMQNLMGMIPLILELELPDAKLKDVLAKKLIGMQNEIKEKIKKDKTKSTEEKEVRSASSERSKRVTVTKEFLTETFEKSNEGKPEKYEDNLDTKPRHDKGKKEIKKTVFPSSALWIGLGILTLILIIAGFYFYGINKSLNENVDGLREEISMLQDEISSNREFIRNYTSLVEFFNYKDIVVIDLTPVEEESEAFGKLYISYSQLKGLLELNRLPSLSQDEVYQLWIVSRGVSYSMGIFRPTFNERYFEIAQIPYISKEEMELARITLEPREGSQTPQGQTQLYGIIVEKNTRRRR